MRTPTLFLFLSAALPLSASAFQQQQGPAGFSRSVTRSSLPKTSSSSLTVSASSPLWSAKFASGGDEIDAVASDSVQGVVRNRLRKATGFSFTVFRATLRGVTGISLTALYAGALAATGLWIRKTMSVLLSVFPSSFRFFLQPFLVLYYSPLILLRSLTSPTNRKRAVAEHETVLAAWKEAVVMAEKTELDGYWPVVVNDDGYFELTKPPNVDSESETLSESDARLAEAMAATVEQAMELKSDSARGNDDKK